MKNIFFSAALFIAATAACIAHIAARTEERATNEVCALIRDNYFRQDQSDVRDFLSHCESDSVPFTFRRLKAVDHINGKLSRIHSSHLNVFLPEENRSLWENEGSDTGLRARMIESEVVVISTLEGSPARKAQLKSGDVIIAINGERPTSAQDAQTTAGEYKIARGKRFFLTDLKLEYLKEDLGPKILPMAGDRALLTIPSFLPGYFEKDSWLTLSKQLTLFRKLVIDLRGNAGGSFPAMLRALSPFRCDDTSIGRIWRTPRPGRRAPQSLQDDLDTDAQLQQVMASDEVNLKTFEKTYGCFAGQVTVLIDSNTSSVSEIFADALLRRSRSRVWGSLSAGRVVMAQWFSISSLGAGDYAMSIPIAGYRASDGAEIEHDGVRPERELHYDLASALDGKDSWVTEGLEQHVSK